MKQKFPVSLSTKLKKIKKRTAQDDYGTSLPEDEIKKQRDNDDKMRAELLE